MPSHSTSFRRCIAALAVVAAWACSPLTFAVDGIDARVRQLADEYCLTCHGYGVREGGLAIDELLEEPLAEHAEQWEAVARRLSVRQMPPAGEPRPSEAAYDQVGLLLTSQLDRISLANPRPGRTETIRRLTRTEYRHAIRDLLALDVAVDELLPADEESHGFDNVTVVNLSPMLLERYISAAQKISRLAVGGDAETAAERTCRVRADVTQDAHIPGTPLGARGGLVVRHYFPQDGQYEVQTRLMRDRNEELEGRPGKYELEILLDRRRAGAFAIERPPVGAIDKSVDENLLTRVHVSAGPHEVGAVFLRSQASVVETVRQPLNVHYNYYRHPRIEPAVYEITVRGPFHGSTPRDTPSRRRIFAGISATPDDQQRCAEQILTPLLRRAYRREIDEADLQQPLQFFAQGRQNGGFDAGIEKALAAILVNPSFLFRVQREPPSAAPGEVYPVTDVELASRLSFFLWSSIPDNELLDLAVAGRLREPEILRSQTARMLADERSASLTDNFAAQWLYLQNLNSFTPDMRLYPDFDDNLRQAFREETELFFSSVVRDDRSVLDLIDADDAYLNERLAKHYGIPHVYGSHFRRVALDEQDQRGGLLRQASILCVTSYPTRTSPVIRGKWILENLLGCPPPP
ncbi:MAG: hypothetical protein CMJ58_03410 [Planctomycetaceae bacterium]|nr:hypothetical protein [Planctomycetaceae bacterium]